VKGFPSASSCVIHGGSLLRSLPWPSARSTTRVGTFSVFGFTTPIPYPFGLERTGYLVTDMDTAIQSAKANEADVVVAPFKEPLGRDAVVQWPGGLYMQLYWHTTAQNYAKLDKVPENRVYVRPPRTGRDVIMPRRSIARWNGASLSSER
jgi:hypothetical protein